MEVVGLFILGIFFAVLVGQFGVVLWLVRRVNELGQLHRWHGNSLSDLWKQFRPIARKVDPAIAPKCDCE